MNVSLIHSGREGVPKVLDSLRPAKDRVRVFLDANVCLPQYSCQFNRAFIQLLLSRATALTMHYAQKEGPDEICK